VASGVFQAWRQVGSWGQLTETDYGTVLLLKVTLVAAAIEAGWFSRRWVANRLGVPSGPGSATATAGSEPRPVGPGAATAAGSLIGRAGGDQAQIPDSRPTAIRFRRWLAFEAAIGVAIVALTGVLVDAAPPEGERVAAAARAYTHQTTIGKDLLSVAVYPLVPGSVHVAIQLTNRATVPVDTFQLTAQLTLPARKIGPLTVPLTHQFTGSWVADSVQVPLSGEWQLQVAVLTNPITEVDKNFNFTIYG
jgi:copper transport protein